jgi:hypothetical protein
MMTEGLSERLAIIFPALLVSSLAIADEYQIVPTLTHGSNIDRHEALAVNVTTGDTRVCSVSTQSDSEKYVRGLNCKALVIVSGKMPPGRAFPTAYEYPKMAKGIGIWKIDQTTGAVTFCGAQVEPARPPKERWHCASTN